VILAKENEKKEMETNKERKKTQDRGEKLICYRLQEMRERDGKDPFILMKTPCGVKTNRDQYQKKIKNTHTH